MTTDYLAKPVAEAAAVLAELAAEAGQQPTLLDLGRRFLRAHQARHDAEQAVK